jgi:hypothetical protein
MKREKMRESSSTKLNYFFMRVVESQKSSSTYSFFCVLFERREKMYHVVMFSSRKMQYRGSEPGPWLFSRKRAVLWEEKDGTNFAGLPCWLSGTKTKLPWNFLSKTWLCNDFGAQVQLLRHLVLEKNSCESWVLRKTAYRRGWSPSSSLTASLRRVS